MLLRFAKIAGGLRLLITEAAPIAATSIGLLSARTAAYLVGFGLGSIVSSWLPIIALLVSVTGFFNAGSNSPECEAYRAQMRAIDESNRALMASYQITYAPYARTALAWSESYSRALNRLFAANNAVTICASFCQEKCTYYPGSTCGSLCSSCYRDLSDRIYREARAAAGPEPVPPSPPTFKSYPACTAPDCPPGKKLWTQVIWASSGGNFTDAKGCFIIAYSQDAPTLPVKVEYNPFLPDAFVKSRAISYYLVNGDRYRGLQDKGWKNLESVEGWDKGYWRSESTDVECRGWRPGWSKIVK
jgi:hypothetical protein